MDPIQEIKEKLNIVDVVKGYIQLMPAGKNFKAPCPFHNEKTPSFVVSPDRQTWHCFGSCNEGGDVFSFVMKYENVEFYEALKALAEKAGVELKRVSPASQKEFGVLYDINAAAKDFFKAQLAADEEAQEYLRSRGLKQQMIEEFEIGYAPNMPDAASVQLANLGYDAHDIERSGVSFKSDRGMYIDRFRGRIMFPLFNTFGKVVGFSGRIMPQFDNENVGKYINSPDTPIFNKSRVLFGFDKAKPSIRETKEAVIVEGQMDLLMMHQDGITNAVATSGTALTVHHLQMMRKLAETVILGFDNDSAGEIATERAIDMAHALDFTVKVFRLKGAKDAAEYVLAHPGGLKHELVGTSLPALEYYFSRYLEGEGALDTKAGARLMLQKVMQLYSPLERGRWTKRIAERLGVPEQLLFEEMELLKASRKDMAPHQPAPVPAQPAPAAPSFATRREKIAAQIIFLILADTTQLHDADEAKMYLPERFARVYDALMDKAKAAGLSAQEKDLLDYFELRASLKQHAVDADKIPLEVSFLLKEAKKEYFKERRASLMAQMRDLEKKGDEAAIAAILKEFDEIAKLIDN
jgi:DNA primase